MNGITGLLKIELPDHTVLLSDGGVTVWDGDTYTSKDSVLGSIASVEVLSEGTGREIPTLDLAFASPGLDALTALSVGALRQSRVRLWIAQYDRETGEVTGTPDLWFSGFVDQPRFSSAFKEFSLSVTCVSEFEAMFFKDTGNGQSSTFHKSIYPGETGHDNGTGLSIPVAWGAPSPPVQAPPREQFVPFRFRR